MKRTIAWFVVGLLLAMLAFAYRDSTFMLIIGLGFGLGCLTTGAIRVYERVADGVWRG